MTLLTKLNPEEIMDKSKKTKLTKKKIIQKNKAKKNKARKNLRRKRLLQEKRKRQARIDKIISEKEKEIDEKKYDYKRIQEIDKQELKREEEALNSNPESLKGIAGKVLNNVGSILGINNNNNTNTQGTIGNQIKQTIDEVGKSSKESKGFFSELGSSIVNDYTSTGKNLVDKFTGAKNNIKNNISNKCDINFMNKFDNIFLGCERKNMIDLHNATIKNLKTMQNHFPPDTRDQIILLKPVELSLEKKTLKLPEPLQNIQAGGTKKKRKYKLIKSKNKKKNKK